MKTLIAFLIFISLTLSTLAALPTETPTPIPSATVAMATVAPESSKELPDVVKQLLLWEFWESLAPMILWLLILFFISKARESREIMMVAILGFILILMAVL